MPSSASPRPTSRIANSTSIACPTLPKRLKEAVVATIRRSRGSRPTKEIPSPISVVSGLRCSLGGGSSRCLIRAVNTIEPKNDTASTKITSGAPNEPHQHAAETRSDHLAADWETCSLALPSLIRAGGTSEGR